MRRTTRVCGRRLAWKARATHVCQQGRVAVRRALVRRPAHLHKLGRVAEHWRARVSARGRIPLAVAAAHNRSAAAVALRWVVQQGVPVVTSSDKAEYDEEDLAVFDFNLTAAEMESLAAVR